ncbi:MAG: cell surface protein [Marinilabiliales bacterium]|nr:MAG: cell surface protein [Marinilabiliales bacterium]
MDDSVIENNPLDIADSQKGVFIVNEGNFMYSNASLSYYDIQTKTVYNNVFFAVNNLPLGDVAQSMTISDSTGYITIGNSGKIYVININDYSYKGKITGLTSPRYLSVINPSKAYITDLYAKAISVIDPVGLNKMHEIDVNSHSEYYQHSTEQMVLIDNEVFVSCWSYDNKILVIDAISDQLTDSIVVSKQPNSMVVDKYNRLWVLSDGGFEGSSYGQDTASLSCIDAESHELLIELKFDQLEYSPTDLCTNGTKDSLYFILGNWGSTDIQNAGIYKMGIEEYTIPSAPLIQQGDKYFYALKIDPSSSEIYVSDAKDRLQAGTVLRYSGGGNLVDSFETGILPGDFCFK